MTYQEKHASNLKKVRAIKDDELRAVWLSQLEDTYKSGLAGEDATEWLERCERNAGDDRWNRLYVATCRTAYNAGREAAQCV